MKRVVLSAMLLVGSVYAGGDYVPTTPIAPSQTQVTSTSNNWYIGLGAAAMSTYGKKQGLFSKKRGQDRAGGIVGLVGYDFTENIAVEGRLSYGGISTNFSESLNLSLFVKPSVAVANNIKLYGLLGFGWVKIDGTSGHSDIAKSTAPQFGLGASYKVRENVDLFADYTWLLHDKKAKTLMPDGSKKVSHEALTVGFNYHF